MTKKTFGWRGERSLKDWLFEEPYVFDFFQAVRLIEAMASQGEDDPVRFRASLNLEFAPSDITDLCVRAGVTEMTVAFLSAGGPMGPLPSSFTEDILAISRQQRFDRLDSPEGQAVDTVPAPMAFLDIFHHRLLDFLYRSRKKHAVSLTTTWPEHTTTAGYLFALMGLGHRHLRSRSIVTDRTLLRYVGLLASRPRSASGLVTILADHFGVRVDIEQLVGAWCPIPASQQTVLGNNGRTPGGGQNNDLGRGTVLGTRVWVQDAFVRLRFGPLTLAEFESLFPGTEAHRVVADLVRLYCGPDLQTELEMVLRTEETPTASLGRSRLGWTTFLGRQATDAENPHVTLRLREAAGARRAA